MRLICPLCGHKGECHMYYVSYARGDDFEPNEPTGCWHARAQGDSRFCNCEYALDIIHDP